ncbi:hypothetical protein [Dyella sp.]|uniref:hypothetical protein n=1 Tax=Dyella sp. TaxID=1869338 RepID=UPI002D79D80D|nr:hypothetical protein [Dyella sp.]HET7332341.1 hypothetical protein [Dyella sp.]HET9835148.1 hypothetical protein [Rhodanobacteraceae bacterium]
MSHERTLTDADVQAIAAALEKSIADRFVRKAGMGVLTLAWRGFVLAIILLAGYYMAHGGSR